MLESIVVCAPPDLEAERAALAERTAAIAARLAPGFEVALGHRLPSGIELAAPTVLVNGWPIGHHPNDDPPDWMIEASLVHALEPRHILFLCVANSARSQLADCMARALAPPGVRISSAGSMPRPVRPEVLTVLSELGLDPSGLTSKGLHGVDVDTVQLIVTLCAEEVCPTILKPVPGLHWPIPDPTPENEDDGTDLAPFRAARDRIRERLYVLFHG